MNPENCVYAQEVVKEWLELEKEIFQALSKRTVIPWTTEVERVEGRTEDHPSNI